MLLITENSIKSNSNYFIHVPRAKVGKAEVAKRVEVSVDWEYALAQWRCDEMLCTFAFDIHDMIKAHQTPFAGTAKGKYKLSHKLIHIH